MRVLTPARLCLCLLAIIALTATAAQTTAHPPEEPDHGINGTTYCTLWANDTDAVSVPAYTNTSPTGSDNATQSERCSLAQGTDIPLNSPPAAVDRWNRGEFAEFPTTNASRSIHPPDATLHDGAYIKDAYVEVFAVQPSTRVRLSETVTPRFVAPNGSVLANVDYRVATSVDSTPDDRRVSWTIRDHEIDETRLYSNESVEANTSGEHTSTLPYSLTDEPNRPYTFTVEAEIEVSLRKDVHTCAAHDESGSCTEWHHTVEWPTETLTVRDQVDVVGYDLDVSGTRGVYPNGDLGLVVYKNRPWLGYSHPVGDVRGVWRFYSARDTDWDTLITSTDNGTRRSHSPAHPLQVNAYPIEPGATVSEREHISILETYGTETRPPTLPTNVSLDTLSEPYTASYGIAVRANTNRHNLSNVTAFGLVRGSARNAGTEPFADVPIHASNLSVTISNTTADTVSVNVELTDNTTDEPINTTDRNGYIVLQDRRVNTSENGTVHATLPRPAGGVSARYEPGHWWHTSPGYVGDTDVAYVDGAAHSLFGLIYAFLVPVGLFLSAVFLLGRITNWSVWPPWRGL